MTHDAKKHDDLPQEITEVDLYAKREKIYTRKIEGYFQRIRLYTGWPLLIGFFAVPWLNWDGRQAVLFDIGQQKFHIFGLTLWPQDLSLLGLILILAAFGLFLATTLLGRLWCGYSCPQTVWTSMFMWIEQFSEGSRNQRVRLDSEKLTVYKLRKKALKHIMWLGLAFFTGFTFVGYFTEIKQLTVNLVSIQASGSSVFWVLLFSGLTYLNAGWMREQVCNYMCPYARFQSVMFDSDTLIVSYDPNRGEPRGSRSKAQDYKAKGLGACIDCQVCVQVCPTGIDIRDGLQFQCIGCALCIDACDSIMEKMDYPKGLIRYTTENKLANKKASKLRLKVVGYSAALAILLAVVSFKIYYLSSLEFTVIRDRAQVSTTNDQGFIENRYQLKLVNKQDRDTTYQLSISGVNTAKIYGDTMPFIEAGGVLSLPVRVLVSQEEMSTPVLNMTFIMTDDLGQTTATESRFIQLSSVRK